MMSARARELAIFAKQASVCLSASTCARARAFVRFTRLLVSRRCRLKCAEHGDERASGAHTRARARVRILLFTTSNRRRTSSAALPAHTQTHATTTVAGCERARIGDERARSNMMRFLVDARRA